MSTIRECIVSRWGDEGFIVEADFSQLEVIGLAFLSQDPVLKRDIADGLDMHCLNTSLIYGVDYELVKEAYDDGDPDWTKKRKKAKAPGFLIQYGGGAEAMAEQSGLSVQECKLFIKRYYQRYQGVAAWQKRNIEEVGLNRVACPGKRSPRGVPVGQSTLVTMTGRRYTFTESDIPDQYQIDLRSGERRLVGFAPTQIKNWPVQGFATGDIVPEVVGRVMQDLMFPQNEEMRRWALLCLAVHDSLVCDVHASQIDVFGPWLKERMTDAPRYLKERFNINFDMNLPADVKVGPNWADLFSLDSVLK